MIPPGADYFKPSFLKLGGLVNISEEWENWIRGSLISDPDIVVEISFETDFLPLPGTHITYLGMWRRGPKGCLFEYQFHKISVVPEIPDWEAHVSPLIERLKGYRPPRIGAS